jgi:hypothetical protein
MKRTLLATIATLIVSAPAFAFSPELRNEDGKSYEYELECGGSTLHSSINGHTSTSLGMSATGCKLKVKGAGVAKLANDMKCNIKNGMLDCT